MKRNIHFGYKFDKKLRKTSEFSTNQFLFPKVFRVENNSLKLCFHKNERQRSRKVWNLNVISFILWVCACTVHNKCTYERAFCVCISISFIFEKHATRFCKMQPFFVNYLSFRSMLTDHSFIFLLFSNCFCYSSFSFFFIENETHSITTIDWNEKWKKSENGSLWRVKEQRINERSNDWKAHIFWFLLFFTAVCDFFKKFGIYRFLTFDINQRAKIGTLVISRSTSRPL